MVDLEQLALEIFGKLSLRNLTPSILTYDFKLCDVTCDFFLPGEKAVDLYFTHRSEPTTPELFAFFRGFNQIRDGAGKGVTIHYQSIVQGNLYGRGVLYLPTIH